MRNQHDQPCLMITRMEDVFGRRGKSCLCAFYLIEEQNDSSLFTSMEGQDICTVHARTHARTHSRTCTCACVRVITSAMQSINGASLKEHWAAQHCLQLYMEAIVAQCSRVYST